jgi:hypothetical protein
MTMKCSVVGGLTDVSHVGPGLQTRPRRRD